MLASEMVPPPPSPCTPRQMQSQVVVWAAPHMAEPKRKRAMATQSMGFRPTKSDMRPYSGITAVDASR